MDAGNAAGAVLAALIRKHRPQQLSGDLPVRIRDVQQAGNWVYINICSILQHMCVI